jgi:hypothetical protein
MRAVTRPLRSGVVITVERPRRGNGKVGSTHIPHPIEEAADMAEQGPWFFCLKHHTVETRDGCAERHRLGPYATREEAEHAVQSVAEREEKLTSEDRAWEGD